MIHCHGVGGLARKRDVPTSLNSCVNNVNEVSLPTRLVRAALDVKKLVGGIENRPHHAIRKFYFNHDLVNSPVTSSTHPKSSPPSVTISLLESANKQCRAVTKSLDGVNPFAVSSLKTSTVLLFSAQRNKRLPLGQGRKTPKSPTKSGSGVVAITLREACLSLVPSDDNSKNTHVIFSCVVKKKLPSTGNRLRQLPSS